MTPERSDSADGWEMTWSQFEVASGKTTSEQVFFLSALELAQQTIQFLDHFAQHSIRLEEDQKTTSHPGRLGQNSICHSSNEI